MPSTAYIHLFECIESGLIKKQQHWVHAKLTVSKWESTFIKVKKIYFPSLKWLFTLLLSSVNSSTVSKKNIIFSATAFVYMSRVQRMMGIHVLMVIAVPVSLMSDLRQIKQKKPTKQTNKNLNDEPIKLNHRVIPSTGHHTAATSWKDWPAVGNGHSGDLGVLAAHGEEEHGQHVADQRCTKRKLGRAYEVQLHPLHQQTPREHPQRHGWDVDYT